MTDDIKEIENKDIVSINFDEKPKKNLKKLPKLSEKEAIQTIKIEEKSIHKPFISEIQEEKSTKIEDLQKEIDNQKIALELRIKEAKEEKINLLKELKIKSKAEKKEQKAKRKAERKEKRRKHWYFRMFMRKEKQKEIPKEVYSNPNEIKLIEVNDTIPKICPICFAKIKKKKVSEEKGIFRQLFKCKKCNYNKTITISIE